MYKIKELLTFPVSKLNLIGCVSCDDDWLSDRPMEALTTSLITSKSPLLSCPLLAGCSNLLISLYWMNANLTGLSAIKCATHMKKSSLQNHILYCHHLWQISNVLSNQMLCYISECVITSGTMHTLIQTFNWAASWQNQRNGMCAQQRLRSVWVSAQSDQSSQPAWRKLGSWSWATYWAHSEDSDQTGQMPRLIRVFKGCTVILLVLSWGGSTVKQDFRKDIERSYYQLYNLWEFL